MYGQSPPHSCWTTLAHGESTEFKRTIRKGCCSVWIRIWGDNKFVFLKSYLFFTEYYPRKNKRGPAVKKLITYFWGVLTRATKLFTNCVIYRWQNPCSKKPPLLIPSLPALCSCRFQSHQGTKAWFVLCCPFDGGTLGEIDTAHTYISIYRYIYIHIDIVIVIDIDTRNIKYHILIAAQEALRDFYLSKFRACQGQSIDSRAGSVSFLQCSTKILSILVSRTGEISMP